MKIKISLSIIYLFAALLGSHTARAESGISWSEIRLFGTVSKLGTAPDTLNSLTAADKVNALSSLTGFGFEADAHILPVLKAGFRYSGNWTLMTPNNAPNPPIAFMAVQQSKWGLILRVPIVEKDWLRFDIFGEGGIANSHVDVQTTGSGQGTFTKNGSFYKRAGASLGFGWKSTYLFVEAGQEWNALDGVGFAGTLSNSITSIDLGGTYYGLGLIFSGVPSWIKVGGVSTEK